MNMNAIAANYTDTQYIAAHRFIYGTIGEYVAQSALLFRDHLLRAGFVLPMIRLAPVAPYGKCLAISANSSALNHVSGLAEGVWLYLHRQWYAPELRRQTDEVLLHELLHNELMQFEENPQHKSKAWARRCQELSNALSLNVRIERPRSQRINGKVTTATPSGCLSYGALARWPADLLAEGPSLWERISVVHSCKLHRATGNGGLADEPEQTQRP